MKIIWCGAPKKKVRGSETTEAEIVFAYRLNKPFHGAVRTGWPGERSDRGRGRFFPVDKNPFHGAVRAGFLYYFISLV